MQYQTQLDLFLVTLMCWIQQMDQQNEPLLSWIQGDELDIPLCLVMIVSIIPSIRLLLWYVYKVCVCVCLHYPHHSSQGFVIVAVGSHGWVLMFLPRPPLCLRSSSIFLSLQLRALCQNTAFLPLPPHLLFPFCI